MQCPKCKRTNTLNFMPWLGLIYQCRKCGYRGPIAIEKKKTKAMLP